MGYEPRLIAPFENSGLNKYYKPWLIGKEAFPELQDAYPWRGNVRKREGFRLLAALPAGDKPVMGLKNWIDPSSLTEQLIAFSQTKSYIFNTSTSIFNDITFYAYPTGGLTAGQPFTWIGGPDDYFWATNYQGSMWVTNNIPADHIKYWNGNNGILGTSGGWSNFTPLLNGSQVVLNTALIILPYKGRLVVLNTTEGTTNIPNRARWSQIGTAYAGAAQSTTNQAIALNTPAGLTTITSNAHGLTTGDTVIMQGFTGADANKINLISFVVTVTGPNTFTIPLASLGLAITLGASFTQLMGVPPAPFTNDMNAWRDDIPGKGGFVDADTSQRIVSAEIIKDTLIVAFQRSTWRLTYTGLQIQPFIWERLNTQFGAESTFSNVAFDESVLFFSRYGWIGCDTNNVARIDEQIPDDSFSAEPKDANLTGLRRVQGIRDFYRQFAYWTFETENSLVGANEIYAYNYLQPSWSIFVPIPTTDSEAPINIRTFGVFRSIQEIKWSNFVNPGPDPPADSWENQGQQKWNSVPGGIDNFPVIVSGDQNGNVYTMFEFQQTPGTDNGNNFSFSITTKRFNPYIDQGLKCRMGYVDLYFTEIPNGEILFQHFIDDQTGTPILEKVVELSKRGVVLISAITIGVVTTITTSTIHDLQSGELVYIANILGNVGDILNDRQFIATVISNTQFTVPVDSSGYVYTKQGTCYSAEDTSGDAIYTRIYLNVTANFHQFVLTMTPDQVQDPAKGVAQFELQGILLWTRPAARLKG